MEGEVKKGGDLRLSAAELRKAGRDAVVAGDAMQAKRFEWAAEYADAAADVLAGGLDEQIRERLAKDAST